MEHNSTILVGSYFDVIYAAKLCWHMFYRQVKQQSYENYEFMYSCKREKLRLLLAQVNLTGRMTPWTQI